MLNQLWIREIFFLGALQKAFLKLDNNLSFIRILKRTSMFSKHMMVGLVLAITGIGLFLYYIFNMVLFQEVDHSDLFFVGIALNISGISYYIFHLQQQKNIGKPGD